MKKLKKKLKKKYNLDELLEGINKDNLHEQQFGEAGKVVCFSGAPGPYGFYFDDMKKFNPSDYQ